MVAGRLCGWGAVAEELAVPGCSAAGWHPPEGAMGEAGASGDAVDGDGGRAGLVAVGGEAVLPGLRTGFGARDAEGRAFVRVGESAGVIRFQ